MEKVKFFGSKVAYDYFLNALILFQKTSWFWLCIFLEFSKILVADWISLKRGCNNCVELLNCFQRHSRVFPCGVTNFLSISGWLREIVQSSQGSSKAEINNILEQNQQKISFPKFLNKQHGHYAVQVHQRSSHRYWYLQPNKVWTWIEFLKHSLIYNLNYFCEEIWNGHAGYRRRLSAVYVDWRSCRHLQRAHFWWNPLEFMDPVPKT